MSKRIFFAPLVCLCLYCIFAFLTFSVPLFGILCPVAIMLFGAFSLLRNSKIALGAGTVVIAAVTYIIYKDLAYSVVYSLGYVAAGFLLCYTILKRKSGAYTIVSVLVCLLISDYGAVAISNLAMGKPAFSFIDEMFETLRPVVLDSLGKSLQEIGAQNIEIIFDQYAMAIRMVLPAMLIIMSLFETILLCFIVKVIVNKVTGAVVVDLRFSMFKADGVTVFVFLLSAILSMFAGDSVIAVVFGNIYMILNVVLVLCGMSLFDWYLKDVQKVKFGFRLLIFALVGASFLIPVLPLVFSVVALLDARRNFRLIGKNASGK